MPPLILIAAQALNRVIGHGNQLCWHLPEDLQHFRALTQGHTVLMGRKTWESLPPRFRPLPGRRNLIISRNPDYQAPGGQCHNSLSSALAGLPADQPVFVIGGAQIYEQALPLATRLEITQVDLSPEGDAYFPPLAPEDWLETARETHTSTHGIGFAFISYQRRQGSGF